MLFGLNRYRLRYRARQSHRAAARLIALLDRPQQLSATLRIGTICSTMAASVAATLLALRQGAPGTLAPSPFILTLAVLMLAHPFGRLLAILPPPLFAYPASRPLKLVSLALSPLTRLLLIIGQDLRQRIGKADQGAEPDDAPSLVELRDALQADDLPLPAERRAMLLGVLELDKVSVEDVMIPRHEVNGIDLLGNTALLEQVRTASHTRLPVYRNSLNQTEGILHMRRLAGRSELDEAAVLLACDVAYFVPEGTTLANQLVSFQQHKYRTAVVVDEYGEAMGIVTLEDILEEIVGDLTGGNRPSSRILPAGRRHLVDPGQRLSA
ncbi:CNNM domain-containing protein [Pseudomonas sp. OHS18]|uniref:CNNM domain-containing protein n=1 Tax=Pseudomonas sp. OHS18 TaxID=3399679 RepID=UPI003A89B92D